MADVLSQSQIDALLAGMAGGGETEAPPQEEVKEKEYRKYDFYSPKKITKERIRLLRGVYDSYSRMASSRLNGVLRVNSEMNVMHVEEQRFYEFSNMLNEDDVIITQEVELQDRDVSAPIVMHINQTVMLSMIDRMLGWESTDMTDDGIDNSYVYTEIERALYRQVMDHFLEFNTEAWTGYVHLNTGETVIEDNPSMFQKISLDETVAIITVEIEISERKGLLTICLPRTLLTEIFSVIDSKQHMNDNVQRESADTKAFILSKIKESNLSVRVGMETAQTDVRAIHNLKVGDVINFGKPKDSPVYVEVGGKTWLKGRLGTYKKDTAVLVDGRVDAEEDEAPPDGELQTG